MTTECCTDVQKLVRWSIVFLKPGGPQSFPGWEGREELISSCTSRPSFEAEKVAEFFRAHPEIPAVDGRFVRVYSEVLRSYDKPAWDFDEAQIGVLEQIRDALEGDHRKHRVRLPKTMRLAGPLNPDKSEFGDEFVNMPDYLGAHPKPGHTFLTGWVEVIFSEPQGDTAELLLNWFGVGTPVVITFGGGQQFDFFRTKTFPLPFLPNFQPVQTKAKLDLATGKVLPESVQIFATFQGTAIARTDRVNRIPYAFPYIFPPLDPSQLKIDIPPDYQPPNPMPPIFGNLDFALDFDGNITGFELHSETFAPVGLFPYIQDFFPPYSFGPKNQFHFALPDRCLVGTPPQNCPNQEDDPDGILTSVNVYFHPHLDLVTEEMSEVPLQESSPASSPERFANAVVVEARGRLYRVGGTEGNAATNRVDVYDPGQSQWTAGPKLPHAVESAQGAAVGGRIYVFGGRPGADQPPVGYTQVFDIEAGTWKVLAQAALPVPVAEGTAAAVDEKIYVISGWRSKNNKNELSAAVQIFDTQQASWSEGASAALPAAGACAVAVDDEVLVIGGRLSGKTVTRRTAVYDVRSNQWSTGPDTLEPVYQAAGGHLEGSLLLVGGRSKVDGPILPVTQELVLRNDQWRPGLPPLLGVAAAGGAVLDG
ncbi:MAG TPA: hypothetical protein VEW48_16445, partial [Thermoanaerobaculia bacterium]|nr:hypothetical protein [Thermoanaerobaculia bacterium]